MIQQIKAVIFDLNGLFVESAKLSERFQTHFGISPAEFMPALTEVLTKARLPDSPDLYTLWQPHLKRWNIKMSGGEFLEFWFSAEGGSITMIKLARELKSKNLKLFVLSNNFKERSEYYAKNFPFFTEIFDKIYYSWQTGFVKPDPRAYDLILRENGLQPGEVMYFDDVKANVDAANTLGIKARLFVDAQSVRDELL